MNDNNGKITMPRTISLGNYLTIFTMLVGGASLWVRIEVTDARQGENITDARRRIDHTETRIGVADAALRIELSAINQRLATIEGYLRRSAASPP